MGQKVVDIVALSGDYPQNQESAMLGRREFGIAGLSAAATLAMKSTSFGQPAGRPGREGTESGHQGVFEECAKACSDCQRECEACANHCTDLLTEGKKEHATTLRTCQDCADVCATAASIVARKGPFSADICRACAEVCAKCAKKCERHDEDEMMKRCAEECRKCEKACREMLQHADQAGQQRSTR